MIYYQTKVSYTKETGDGKVQSAKEVYLVRALSYADAETRILETVSVYSHDGLHNGSTFRPEPSFFLLRLA